MGLFLKIDNGEYGNMGDALWFVVRRAYYDIYHDARYSPYFFTHLTHHIHIKITPRIRLG